MGSRRFIHIALIGASALTLAACAADSNSQVPEFMRARAADPPPPEPPPNVKQLLHDQLESVFVSTSYPRGVRVSPPHHAVHGEGWTACVRAEVNSATGKPIGTQTYRITINEGVIADRRRAGADDDCVSESYAPI